jgi:hypothetical protein
MLKDKLSVSVQVGKRFAADATNVAKTTTVAAAHKTKNLGTKTVNSTVKATKTSTRFVADQASKIPTIGDQS